MIIHDCEQGTPEWKLLRASKPTSSRFGSLVTGTGKPSDGMAAYALELATEAYIGGPLDDGFAGNKYTERGKELEPVSAADYEMTHQVKIQHVGFITDDLLRWGTSTDGLVGNDGIVEFKNLIARRFMELLVKVKKTNKTPPVYIPQIQGELFITERKWCDIVFYHPQFEPIVHRHYPIPEFQAVLKAQLIACLAERNNILKLVKS